MWNIGEVLGQKEENMLRIAANGDALANWSPVF